VEEAEAHRVLAMFEPEYSAAMVELDAAEKALEERHRLSPSERDEEHAQLLVARAVRDGQVHNPDGNAATAELEKMAEKSRSQTILLAYRTAHGATLMAQGKFADAIPELEEDANNPIAVRLLWQAYSQSGQTAQADAVAARLAGLNLPTPEQALVELEIRSRVISKDQHP
jgi:predicted Zn-dependent protease